MSCKYLVGRSLREDPSSQMRKLSALNEGDRFRTAHPRQQSLNRRRMDREHVFRVKSVYQQSPYTVISVREDDLFGGIYSLRPGTPVLFPRDLDPSEEEVYAFLGVAKRRRTTHVRLNWDGQSSLESLPPQAAALVRGMYVLGIVEASPTEIAARVAPHIAKFIENPGVTGVTSLLRFYKRKLVNEGFMTEFVDLCTTPASVIEAGLQDEFSDEDYVNKDNR